MVIVGSVTLLNAFVCSFCKFDFFFLIIYGVSNLHSSGKLRCKRIYLIPKLSQTAQSRIP